MVIIIIALIVISGFFSLFEQALERVRKARLHIEADAKDSGKARRFRRLLKALDDSDRYFTAARFWIVSSRTFAGILAGYSVGHFKAPQSAALPVFLPLALCIIMFVIAVLLLGSLIPRIAAGRAPEKIAAAVFPLCALFAIPLRPLYLVMQSAGRQLRSMLPPAQSSPA